MVREHSLTPEEVAEQLKIKKNTVYEMIKRGDLEAYRVGRKLRIDSESIADYKRKQGRAIRTTEPVKSEDSSIKIRSVREPHTLGESLVICGQDVLLDIMASYLEGPSYGCQALRLQTGSLGGLNALYNGKADVATVHLWDGHKDEYNISYVKYLIPGVSKLVIRLVSRMEGFYVAAGNPLNITDWEDLARSEVRFINREKGSGTRVLLDEKLRIYGIDRRRIQGYKNEAMSHLEVASAVASREVDVGLGIEKAALQVRGVEFIPIQKECCDMVVLKESLDDPRIQAVIEVVRSREFKTSIQAMGDYDVAEMGRIIEV